VKEEEREGGRGRLFIQCALSLSLSLSSLSLSFFLSFFLSFSPIFSGLFQIYNIVVSLFEVSSNHYWSVLGDETTVHRCRVDLLRIDAQASLSAQHIDRFLEVIEYQDVYDYNIKNENE
jgi:hypothetical protein